MSWNYRVMEREYYGPTYEVEPYVYYTIHEVYYGVDKENPEGLSWTKDAIAPQGESVEEIREILTKMLACLDKPILEYKEEDKLAT